MTIEQVSTFLTYNGNYSDAEREIICKLILDSIEPGTEDETGQIE